MWSALACIPIYQSVETKDGHKPCMCRVAYSALTPSRMTQHTSTTLLACITMQISCMWDLSQHRNLIESTDEEAHK